MKPNKPGQSSHLKDVIPQGWPEYPNECPSDLKEFWNFREDLCLEKRPYPKGTPASDPESPAHPDATNHPPRQPWCGKV